MSTRIVERIAFETDGSGDPVLMIHGLGGSSNTFSAIAPAFARHLTIRPDLPGSARSAGVAGELSIERFVQAMLRVLSAAAVERVHVVGHSLGTIVATHLAAGHPNLVRSLLLFGPLLCPPDPARETIRARARRARDEGAPGMQAIADALVTASTSTQTRTRAPAAAAFVRESLMRQDPDGYARTCEALAGARSADTAAITCPVMLVTGDEDAVAPPQAVRMMAERLGGARTEVLRGCGHWTPIEQPEPCMALAREFLARRT